MLVIHPQKSTTAFLSTLYKGTGAKVLNIPMSDGMLKKRLEECPQNEPVMLLGEGTEIGLDAPTENPLINQRIIWSQNAQMLRDHGGEYIGLWHQAYKFARKESLHGLFTGRLITDKQEAESYGIITLQHHIDEVNEAIFTELRNLLDQKIPLREIPERMQPVVIRYSWLTGDSNKFFYYL